MLNRGVKVVLAGGLINFSLGLIYSWSVFAEGLIHNYGWTNSAAVLPYTLELIVLSFAMIFAGRFQDRMGPRKAVMISGLLTGAALLLSAFAIHPLGLTLLFGLVYGIADAFGYAAATPAALKWFPPHKRGLITGLVIMPMGAAALIWSPLLKSFIGAMGLRFTFGFCGLFLLVTITLAAQMITLPEESGPRCCHQDEKKGSSEKGNWRLLLRNPVFILLWLMMGFSAFPGVMFIGQLLQIAELNFQVFWGYLLVSLFSLTSMLGRLCGGLLCDRIGYLDNIRLSLLLMAAAMLLLISGWGAPALAAATLLLGTGYGSIYTSFSASAGHLFGLRNFGLTYGMLFTSLGATGCLGPLAAALLADRCGSYSPAFLIGLGVIFACFLLSLLLQNRIGDPVA